MNYIMNKTFFNEAKIIEIQLLRIELCSIQVLYILNTTTSRHLVCVKFLERNSIVVFSIS